MAGTDPNQWLCELWSYREINLHVRAQPYFAAVMLPWQVRPCHCRIALTAAG